MVHENENIYIFESMTMRMKTPTANLGFMSSIVFRPYRAR